MACVNCHRRSGMGGAEGPLVVPPIVGSVLFSPVTQGAPQIGTAAVHGPRHARGLHGRDAAARGARRRRRLGPGSLADDAALRHRRGRRQGARRLPARARRRACRPAWSDAIVHLATIVTPGVDAGARASMLDVLRTFVRAKNGGTRYETRRRTSGGWDMKQQYQNYRDWVLDEWELRGDAEGVAGPARGALPPPAGLRDRRRDHRRGLVAGRRVLRPAQDPGGPPADAAAARRARRRRLLLSLLLAGRRRGGAAIARHLEAATPRAELRQLSRCGTAGQAAATELARAFPAAAARTACVPAATSLTAETWRTLVGSARRLVLWLDGRDREGLEALAASGSLDEVSEVYLSSTLLGEAALRLPAPLAERAVLAHPFVTPDEFDRHAARSLLWMKRQRPAGPRTAESRSTPCSPSCSRPTPSACPGRSARASTSSRRSSTWPAGPLNPTAYPSVSFDPRRRFASEGAYLLKLPSSPDQPFGKVEEWSVPRS